MAIELDFFEYASDAAAQAAYVSSDTQADVVDQQQLLVTYFKAINGESGNDERQAQEFQVSENLTCVKISVLMKKENNPTDSVVIRIETDSAGVPSDVLVNANATKAIAGADIPSSDTWVDFVFPATFSLNVSTVYHLVMARWGARDITNKYVWMYKDSDPYANGQVETRNSGVWSNISSEDFCFKIYKRIVPLQCYSENAIKTQGSYALKSIAKITASLNDTLTRTVSPTINLSGINTLKFDIRASRTGSNIKISIHDSGGVTTEKTHAVGTANTWETDTWDISAVANANKDAIDQIIITIVNADADNTFYVDNFYLLVIYTLAIGAGSYAVTGQTISPLHNKLLAIGAGSYAVTGQDLNLLRDYVLGIEAGSYTVTGQTLGTLYHRIMALDAGSYTLTGQDLSFLFTYILSLGAGSYTLTGQDLNLLRDYILDIGAGSYTVTGQALSALYNRILALDAGNYTLTGQDLSLTRLLMSIINEAIGVREKELNSKKIYSGGEDIVIRRLKPVWQTIPKESTIWQIEEKRKPG